MKKATQMLVKILAFFQKKDIPIENKGVHVLSTYLPKEYIRATGGDKLPMFKDGIYKKDYYISTLKNENQKSKL